MVEVDAALLRSWPLPIPEHGDKDTRGRAFIVAGAASMPGAAVLAATAALRAGAGKLQIGTGASVATQVGIAVLEALVVALPECTSGGIDASAADAIVEKANGCDAFVLGPGMVDESQCARLLQAVAPRLRTACVLDAAVLNCFANAADVVAHLDPPAVLTPHAGEMAAMMGAAKEAVEDDPPRWARDAAARFGAVVVLKGATTYIADPAGALYRHRGGTIGLATSGSGDTLAGIVGGLLARGLPPVAAAAWAVHLHAQAGAVLERRMGMGFLARELLAEIPALMRSLSR